MGDFAAQVKERWSTFTHKGRSRSGLRQSLCRTLTLPDEDESTWERCTALILEGALKHFPRRKDAEDTDVFHGVIAEMFPEKSRLLIPQKMSKTDWPWLCWENASGETPTKAYYRKNRGIHDFMSDISLGPGTGDHRDHPVRISAPRFAGNAQHSGSNGRNFRAKGPTPFKSC